MTHNQASEWRESKDILYKRAIWYCNQFYHGITIQFDAEIENLIIRYPEMFKEEV